jgi:hypothetical protein
MKGSVTRKKKVVQAAKERPIEQPKPDKSNEVMLSAAQMMIEAAQSSQELTRAVAAVLEQNKVLTEHLKADREQFAITLEELTRPVPYVIKVGESSPRSGKAKSYTLEPQITEH